MTTTSPGPEVRKDRSQLRQKAMIADHFARLLKDPPAQRPVPLPVMQVPERL